ncbi:MAG: hypothetical protein ACD_39C01582G0001 [uncultured bacterium]|nr:MAG: hypothetical protein ACD_39C01582G0001 [uncultured bacterium]
MPQTQNRLYLKLKTDRPAVLCSGKTRLINLTDKCLHTVLCRAAAVLFFATCFLAGNTLWSADRAISASFSGPCYFRLPGFHSFVLQNGSCSMPEGTLITVRPDVEMPTATGSCLLVGSYTVTMLPGATVKAVKRGFIPLSGRFVFNGAGDETLIFLNRVFELHYRSGELLLEITPDDGIFIAMRNKGDAFVKDLQRSIYDLKPGQELHFPLFGKTKLKKRLSGFWEDPPTGFSAARRRPEPVSMSDDEEVDEESEDDNSNDVDQDSANDREKDSEEADSIPKKVVDSENDHGSGVDSRPVED